ncbi:hypothetical protein HLK66_22885 [Niallia circulans]|uniref:hypothetical protein n=1 Tax=Niallia circulans TaxID=1397 RepID=UPI00148F80F4|nr:hypothetical protein [Niallia circulans]QJX64205.1 hypothetical protein HLK66_22885 [Niallia circulans]
MKKFLSTLGMALIGGVFGGALMLALLSQEWSITNILISVVCFLAFYIIHIILHEGGHLIFGKLTGYSLVSFRVFSWMVVATKDGLKWKKLHMPGTLGQCLMAPPEYVKGKYPFKLYLCGGVIINFLSSLVVGGIPWIIYGNAFPFPVTLFVLLGLFIGVTNIIPYGFNDGMTLKMAWSNEKKQWQLFSQFYINAQTSNGVSYQELPEELFALPDGDDGKDYFSQWGLCMQQVRAMDRLDFEEAKRINDILWARKDELISLFRVEVAKERLFLLTVLEGDKEEVQSIYKNKEVKRFLAIKQMSNKRIAAAYELHVNGDRQKATALCEEGAQLEKHNPNMTDIVLEKRLMKTLLAG